MSGRNQRTVPCDACGTLVTLIGRSKQHCDNEECAIGWARKRVEERIEKVGDCEIWQGEFHRKGGAAVIRMNVTGHRRDLRVLALRDPDGDKAKYRIYINSCGTQGCVNVDHHYIQIGRKGQPPSQQILAHLPVEPVDRYVRENKIVLGQRGHKPLQQARKKGYFTVTGADAFCIDTLGIHPSILYGEAFYTAGAEDAA